MPRGGGRNSVVLTKYGERPLIDMPPLSLSPSRADDEDVPTHLFRVPGKRASHVFHQPPRSPQVSLTAPQPQRRYQEPLMEQPTHYQHPHQSPNRSYYQPQYPNQPPPQYQNQPPPPPTHFQPQVQQTHYSNLAPDSNLVPYEYTHYRPHPQMPQPVPQYNTPTHAPEPIPEHVPNGHGTQQNEVHVYYGPNGERLPGPLPRPRYPTDFTLEGTLEYGKLVSVKVRNSNISYREIPDFVFQDLYKTYRMMERIDVKIVAQGGEYNIYATSASNETVTNNPGYVYEQPVRQVPVVSNQRETYDPRRRRQSHDPFTKIYRYERDSLRERYPPVSKRGRSHLDDIGEDYDEESQLMTRDTFRTMKS